MTIIYAKELKETEAFQQILQEYKQVYVSIPQPRWAFVLSEKPLLI